MSEHQITADDDPRTGKPATDSKPGIHPSARVDPTATIDPSATRGPGTRIGAHTTVGEHATVGENTDIGARTTVDADVRIGERCAIGSDVTVETDIGEKVKVGDHSHLHAAMPTDASSNEIGDDVTIGRGVQIFNAEVETRAVIGDEVRLEREAVVRTGATIESNAIVDQGGTVGARATVGEHSKVDHHAEVGAGARTGDNTLIVMGNRLKRDVHLGDHSNGQAGAWSARSPRGERLEDALVEIEHAPLWAADEPTAGGIELDDIKRLDPQPHGGAQLQHPVVSQFDFGSSGTRPAD